MRTPTVIDLFCGIGGFSKGFEKAGFKILLGIDNWETSLKTFKENHYDTEVLLKDIKELNNDILEKYENKVDVIIGGPPCQGFSMSGKRDAKDIRNTLFEDMLKVVSIVKPKVVIMENVVGLLSMKSDKGILVKDLIYERFEKYGYKVKHKVLNASDYGVPQHRKRVIFIGTKQGEITFPLPSHFEEETLLDNKKITVGDALGNIPNIGEDEEYLEPKTNFQKMMSNGTKKIFNHNKVNHSNEVSQRMSFVPQGGNWKDIPKEYYNVGGEHSNNYRRLHSKKPSVTMKHATKSMIIHPKYNRCLTVREVARLQGFYDSFIIHGTISEQHQQLANAVPPLLGYSIAKEIKKILK